MTNEVPDLPLLVMFAILAICLIAYMMLHHRFFARIRKYHPAIWDSLGRPSFTDSDPIHVNFRWCDLSCDRDTFNTTIQFSTD